MALNSPNPAAIVIKGVGEAPVDGQQYARQDADWQAVAPSQGKNLIINGNLTVDQRGVYTEYVADRWKVVDASNMTQIIEDKNFEPSTEYTLSWEGSTPQQITSPASGHWTLPNIPRTARKIQLEKGNKATEFEYEDYGTTLAKCMRYYEAFDYGPFYPGGFYGVFTESTTGKIVEASIFFKAHKRTNPMVDNKLVFRNSESGINEASSTRYVTPDEIRVRGGGSAASGTSAHLYGNWEADAEL